MHTVSTPSSSFYSLTFSNLALSFVILERLLPRAHCQQHLPSSQSSCKSAVTVSSLLKLISVFYRIMLSWSSPYLLACAFCLCFLPPSSALCCFALYPLFLPVCTLTIGFFIQSHSLKYYIYMNPKFLSSPPTCLLSCRLLYLTTCLLDISIYTSPCILNIFHTEFFF